METSLELGLSGPGRLHDLFVTHEAMSPGEWKARGAGLTIRYGYHPSPFGLALVMITDRGLAGLAFADAGGEVGDAARQRVAHFSGWRFDVARLSLYAPDGGERPLSAGEGLMLLRFLERPNRVLPREQLLGQHDISPFDRSIDVRISRLRRKLEDDSYNPRLIKTVYGAGYLFVSSVVWE